MNENLQNRDAKIERIKELTKALNDASTAYYGGKEEIISNFEWDSMFDELLALEKETSFSLPDSPTKTTGTEESGSNRDAHEFPALSLAKTKKISDLQEWAGDRDIYLSYKLDGLTLVITYDNGMLTKILTRGNGIVGKNITFLKDSISGYPLTISYKGHMVVRGEATISYTDFEYINDLFEDEDDRFANPRNLASGTLALDDPEKVKERRVKFNAFTLVHIDDDIKDWGDRMDFLNKEGFVTVDHTRCKADALPEVIEDYTARVESGDMDMPVDGLVICYADNDYAMSGSVTGHHATRAGLAFKWADVSAFSKLKYIEWSCAASTISPVAVFESVELEGTNVSRASLCNISEMERLGIGDECTVEVIKANKIIPKCISVKDSNGHFTIPEICPVCKSPTRIVVSPRSGTKTLQCANPDCSAKQGKKFTRFVSKSGMDIDGLSIQTMIKFMNMGFIGEFDDIYDLGTHADSIRELEGFGDRSVENMLASIQKSRQVKAVNFIYALCIPMIGLDAGKKLVGNLGFDGFIQRLDGAMGFDDIDGIGPERSAQIVTWYSESKNRNMLQRLLSKVQILDGEPQKISEGTCMGLTFVITGDVHIFKNRDEFKAYVESAGGKVAGSVSGKTSFLVNNDVTSSSSKNMKAKQLNVPIISEDEFVERFGR